MIGSARHARALLGEALRDRRLRRVGWITTVLYLLVYLWAIQNLIVSPGTDMSRFVDIPSVQVAPEWTAKLLRQTAAFSYEPVAAVHPVNHVALLIAPLNIAMGILLGVLVGLNVVLALHVVRTARACRRKAFGGLLGALPGFLTGFACCVPTIALVAGAQFTVALVALRSYFFPFAVAALVVSLLLNVGRARDVARPREAPSRPVPVERPA